MRIKKDDIVVIRAGKDRGEKGKVIAADHENGMVTVQGVNEVFRHVRRSQKNMQGGRLSKFMPVPVANVMVVCPKCQKPTRVEAAYDEAGKKYRKCKKCGGVIEFPKEK